MTNVRYQVWGQIHIQASNDVWCLVPNIWDQVHKHVFNDIPIIIRNQVISQFWNLNG